MKYLITNGAGFNGSNIVEALLRGTVGWFRKKELRIKKKKVKS